MGQMQMKGLDRSIQNAQFIKESFFGYKSLSICELPFGFSVLKYLMGFFCHPASRIRITYFSVWQSSQPDSREAEACLEVCFQQSRIMRDGGTLQASVCTPALLTEQSPKWSLQHLCLWIWKAEELLAVRISQFISHCIQYQFISHCIQCCN